MLAQDLILNIFYFMCNIVRIVNFMYVLRSIKLPKTIKIEINTKKKKL